MQKFRRPTPGMIALAVIAVLIAFRVRTGSSPVEPLRHRTVRVKTVIDGDTFETTNNERVRLRGIDAPEVAHHDQKLEHFGREATDWLRQRIAGIEVVLAIDADEPVDRYGRTLAWIYLPDGTLINQEALETGHAKLMDRFGLPLQLEPGLRAAAENARSERRGMWAETTTAPSPTDGSLPP